MLTGVRRIVDTPYGPETFAVRIEDDSMVPTLAKGHWVYVDPDEPMRPGRMVGVDEPEAGGVTVRRLVEEGGRLLLSADAPGWPDAVVDHGSETLIRGTVVFVIVGVRR